MITFEIGILLNDCSVPFWDEVCDQVPVLDRACRTYIIV